MLPVQNENIIGDMNFVHVKPAVSERIAEWRTWLMDDVRPDLNI